MVITQILQNFLNTVQTVKYHTAQMAQQWHECKMILRTVFSISLGGNSFIEQALFLLDAI